MTLGRDFFTRPSLQVTQELLGKYLVRKIGKRTLAGKIIETEAYIGPQDKASHAYKGKRTPRNRAEYLMGGYVYIYLVYGMYWQLNISTGAAEVPECVLIRALDVEGAKGPGKLCQYLRLDKSFYGEDVTKSKSIWLEDRGEQIQSSQIAKTARIGIDYAGPYWARRKLRFAVKGKGLKL